MNRSSLIRYMIYLARGSICFRNNKVVFVLMNARLLISGLFFSLLRFVRKMFAVVTIGAVVRVGPDYIYKMIVQLYTVSGTFKDMVSVSTLIEAQQRASFIKDCCYYYSAQTLTYGTSYVVHHLMSTYPSPTPHIINETTQSLTNT
jgi:hypothetical protein